MRIAGWRIDGFGLFHQAEQNGLDPGLNVFLGPNEAGKSTLLAFLRAVLFGFPGKRGKAPQYPPLRGGRHGGRVTLCGPAGEVVVERYSGRGGGLTIDGAGAESTQTLLGGADEKLFNSVFAFGLGEMESLEWLEADQVRARIFSAGISGAGASARAVMEKLDAEAASQYRPRGACRWRDVQEQIEAAQARLVAAEADAARYPDLESERDRWSARAAELSGEEQELKARLHEVDAALALWPEIERARAELAGLAVAESEDPEARLSELSSRVESARGMLDALTGELAAEESARDNLAQELDERLPFIAPKVEESYSRLALHRERMRGAGPPYGPLALGASLALAGGWLAARDFAAAGLALALAALAAALAAYSRRMRNHAREAASWENPVREWTGSEARGEALIADFLALRERCLADRERRAKISAREEAIAALRSRLEAGEREFSAAGAALEEFRKRLGALRRRRELLAALAALESRTPPEPPAELEAQRRELAASLARAARERDEAIGKQSIAAAELERIARSGDIPALRAELESLRAEAADCVRRWRVATLARKLVERTLGEFTRTRQPAVLEEASCSFARVTAGAYTRVIQEESGESLAVLDSEMRRKRPEELSRGTAEQLYLCLRLALASEFARRSKPLPLIMDDVLVNFDPERARAVAAELGAAAAARQILIFTCHPETARILSEAAPLARVIGMERGGDSPAGEPAG